MAGRWARQLVVTVAVEADDPAVVGRTGSYRSLAGLARFHELCRRSGVRPTYLLTWSAASEGGCVEFARSAAGEAEFGAHLHPEEVPPVAESERGQHTLRPRDVEPERLRAKLGHLVDRVAEAVGRRPTSYRAGFLDLTAAQVSALAELGIEADSSLGPLEKTREGYPYVSAPMAPYPLDGADVCRPGASGVVEVPVTSAFRRPFPRVFFGAYFAVPGVVRGALRRVGGAELLRFRPAMASGAELVAVCERTERLGVPAVMSIHSNELSAGTSRPVRTEGESAAYFGRLEQVFAHAQERGWASRTLTEVARDLRGGGPHAEAG